MNAASFKNCLVVMSGKEGGHKHWGALSQSNIGHPISCMGAINKLFTRSRSDMWMCHSAFTLMSDASIDI